MDEVKGAADPGGRGRGPEAGTWRPSARELLRSLAICLLLALWPVWRALSDPSRVLFAVDTASVELPWSAALGRGAREGAPPARARNPELSDQGLVFYPAYRWVAARLAAGELPLWNPYVHAGAPGLANPQLGALDPEVWLLALLERLGGRALADWGLALEAWLRLAAAGLGTYLLARRLGIAAPGAGLAAIAFAGSGFVVLWLNHSLGHVAPALPWLLYFVEGTRGRAPARAAAAAALTLWLAILGGHPETACFIGLAAGAWALGFWRRERRAALMSLAGLALGTLAAGASLVPFLEYVERSGAAVARAALTEPRIDLVALGALALAAGLLLWWRAAAVSGGPAGARSSLQLAATAAGLLAALAAAGFPWQALLHDAFGAPGAGGYVGGDGYLERYAAWVPLPVLALALAALFDPAGPLARRGGLVLASLGVWLLALDLPALSALFARLPGLGLAVPARAGVVAVLLLALQAGHALESAGRPARLAGAALVAAGCLAASLAPAPAAPSEPPPAGDPADELVELAVAPPAGPAVARGDGALAISGRVHPAVRAAELELAVERWLGGGLFRRAAPGRVALELGPTADGGRSFSAELDRRALANGRWRVVLELFDAEGARLGARASAAFDVRHAPRASALSIALLAASALALALGPRSALGRRLLVLLALVQAALFARGAQPAVPREECFPETATTAFLARELGGRRYFADRGVLPANTGMLFGLAALDGYDGLDVASFNDLRFAALLPGAHPLLDWGPRGVDLDSPAMRLFGVGALVCARPLEHPAWRLAAAPVPRAGVEPAETWIYLPRDPLPRAFIAKSAVTLEAVRADPAGFDPLREAFVSGAAWSPARPCQRSLVRELAWDDERIELEVELDGDGLLVVTEQHFPGWSARVDGAPRAILAADGIFRGLPLAAGDRRVELVYRPRSLRVGAGLSLAGLLAIGALALSGRRAGRRERGA